MDPDNRVEVVSKVKPKVEAKLGIETHNIILR